MLHYESPPAQYESLTWDARHTLARRPWDVEEPRQLRSRRVGYAALGAASGFGLTLIVLALLVWLWRFFLARLREIADAVRGK